MTMIDRRSILKLGPCSGPRRSACPRRRWRRRAARAAHARLPSRPRCRPGPHARTLAAVQSTLQARLRPAARRESPDLALKPAIVTKWGFENPTTLVLRPAIRRRLPRRLAADLGRHPLLLLRARKLPVPEAAAGSTRPSSGARSRISRRRARPRAWMKFTEPMASAVPWLAFLASFVVPKAYVERVGLAEFSAKPVGSGPTARRVPAGRAHRAGGERALLGGQARHPARHDRAGARSDGARRGLREPARRCRRRRADPRGAAPRRAARRDRAPRPDRRHHAAADHEEWRLRGRSRKARGPSRHRQGGDQPALFGGAATPISVPAAKGHPGYPADYEFPFSVERAQALLRELGPWAGQAARHQVLLAERSVPQRFRAGAAIVQMWRRVGIAASSSRSSSPSTRSGCARHAARSDALLLGQCRR